MQVLPCHHTSPAVVSRCISLYLVVSRCISLYLVVSLYSCISLYLPAPYGVTVQSAAPSSFHASASMPSHISCRCISLYLVVSRCISLSRCTAVSRYDSLYRCISFSRCVSLHLALSCSARTGALNLSAHHGHITGRITGVAFGSHTSLIPDVVVGFVGSPS